MAVQMYLIHPKNNCDDKGREDIADFIAVRRGFILMATSHGSIIAAFDEQYLASVQAHASVAFAGGVTLNPNAPGATALRQLFAQNVALQLASRNGGVPATGDSAQAEEGRFPPGYRPLRWSVSDEGGNG
ncbi:MAG: hypothetical protein JNK38_02600 [Acidobacteria bacterium]|nr:hypothetical protein [Acidobacteriota bacterium]